MVAPIIASLSLGYAAWLKFIEAKRLNARMAETSRSDSELARARRVDGRIETHLERLDQEMEELRAKNEQLEAKVAEIGARLDRAVEYIRSNNLPWPPPVAP